MNQNPTKTQQTKAQTPTRPQGVRPSVPVRPQGARPATPARPQGTRPVAVVRPQGARPQAPVHPQQTRTQVVVRPQATKPKTTQNPQGTRQQTQVKPQEPTKKKKKFGVKKLIPLTLLSLAALGGGKAAYTFNEGVAEENKAENELYEINKVKEDLSYYGGDIRYVDSKPSDFFGIKKPYAYSHFDSSEQETIKISYSDSITEHQKKMFQYTFDYLNSVFEIVNPAVKFEVIEENTKDAQIYVTTASLAKEVGMNVTCKHDSHNKSQIEKATIRVNSNADITDTGLKFYLLHEMLHVLTGSDDVNEHESETFSVYNYMDVGFINRQIENAWESEEEKKAAMDGHLVEVRPVLSKQEKEEFVTFLPTDLGTIIALYGDSDTQLNRTAYVKLLTETLEKCQKVFGENQPYFVRGYTIPEASVRPSDFKQSKEEDMSR